MDYLSRFRRSISSRIGMTIVFISVASCLTTAVAMVMEFPILVSVLVGTVVAFVGGISISWSIADSASEPLQTMQQIVGYAANNKRDVEPPNVDKLRLGRELVTALSHQIYDIASKTTAVSDTEIGDVDEAEKLGAHTLFDNLAHPVLGLDKELNIIVANQALAAYLQTTKEELLGAKFYDRLNLSFQGSQTLDEWLEKARTSKVTDTNSWTRVRHNFSDTTTPPLQFDMIASVSVGNHSGIETLVSLFDKSHSYNDDDQAINFVALAVHELRTPLTIMRGYIEVFEEELGPTLPPELFDFMNKMQASAQSLTAYVSNILNVARVDENQLSLVLQKASWPNILREAVANLELRAQVHGIHLELLIDENLPEVATDRISIQEVINNLVDNAIKYSNGAKKISIHTTLNKEGLVETSVQDYGVGIPSSVMPHLFQKFHRSHKYQNQIGGTGLGLYLCKALVTAHGGNLWVKSKEGEGSLFSFTILPYEQLSAEQKAGEDGIIRGAHGWIKNHSLYRN